MKPRKANPLRLDETAVSANPTLPAFLACPEDAPVYHGFSILDFSVDGWRFGTITGYSPEMPSEEGDAFVVAPDGSRAGIAWALDTDRFYQITHLGKPAGVFTDCASRKLLAAIRI
jgi:hypothetical protein